MGNFRSPWAFLVRRGKEIAEYNFNDKPLSKEMQDILADAEIYFKYPYEISADEMNAYRRKGQSCEITVSGMERK